MYADNLIVSIYSAVLKNIHVVMPEKIIFVHGKPGSGKTTHCDQLDSRTDDSTRHLAVGKRVRAIVKGETRSAFSGLIDQTSGALNYSLVDPRLVYGVVEEFITNHQQPGLTLIDGFPKEIGMIPFIEDGVKRGVLDIAGLVVIQVDDETAINRQLARKAVESSHEPYDKTKAQRRVDEYRDQTVPVIAFLGTEYPIMEIDGLLQPEDTTDLFERAIEDLVPRNIRQVQQEY